MSMFLTLASLFFVGSLAGWVMELLFRRFFSSSNPERKWVNPGFCTGPYLPIYGFGLCLLYLLALLEPLNVIADPFWNKAVLFIAMAAGMTGIEYIAGVFCLKFAKVRLWDYRDEWGNIQGIICPRFSLIWAGLGACYYFLVHPHILQALQWLSQNLAFSFVIGLFYGVLLVDVAQSAQITAKLKKFAEENDVIVRYDAIKAHIRQRNEAAREKYSFFRPFRSERPLAEHLKELAETFERRRKERGNRDKRKK